MARNKKIYNYLTNTFDLSREKILEQVNNRVEHVLEKTLNNILTSNKFEKLILNRITDIVTKKASYYNSSFENFVLREVSEVLEKMIKTSYKFEVSATVKEPNSDRTEPKFKAVKVSKPKKEKQ
jgi:hypothetical protein